MYIFWKPDVLDDLFTRNNLVNGFPELNLDIPQNQITAHQSSGNGQEQVHSFVRLIEKTFKIVALNAR